MKTSTWILAAGVTALVAGMATGLAAPATAPAPTPETATAPATATAPTRPSAAEAEKLLEGVRKQLEGLHTVQGEFVQEKKLAIFKRPLLIKGSFAVDRPKRLVWHVAEPVKYSVQVEGDTVRFWDEDTAAVQTIHIGPKHEFRAVFDQFQGWFLGDYRSLTESYDVIVESQTPLVVSFAPKAKSPMEKIITRVEITFQEDRQYLASLVIREGGGDTTSIRFVNTRLNRDVPAETWEIPPHGH